MTAAPQQLWVYRARVTKVVDGDTADVVIDAGFRATRTERLRLLGVNTPEFQYPCDGSKGCDAAYSIWGNRR